MITSMNLLFDRPKYFDFLVNQFRGTGIDTRNVDKTQNGSFEFLHSSYF